MKVSDLIQFNDRQKEAFAYIGKGARIFYGGARGGGKSYFARAAAMIAAMQFPGISIVFIRETYNELNSNFIMKIEEEYDGALWKYKLLKKDQMLRFENGSKIHFRAAEKITDAKKFQGLEYQFMIIDEAPNVLLGLLIKLMGSLRNATIKNFIPTILMTGNPGGGNDKWFQVRFVNPDYKYWNEGELKHKEKYVFVPATVYDNRHVGTDYMEMLETLPEHLKEAWLNGRWDVFAGQFFEEFNVPHHVIPEFPIPSHWIRVCGIDLGYTEKHPTVCLWGAQDPEDGTVYIYREYVGGKTGSTEISADEIISYSEGENIYGYWLDPAAFAEKKDRADSVSPGRIFEDAGVMPLFRANNARVPGWEIVKQWLHWRNNQDSKLKIFDTCFHLIETMPQMVYVQEGEGKSRDLDSDRSDDAVDALRYLLMSGVFEYPTHALLNYKNSRFLKEEKFSYEDMQKRFVEYNPERYIAEDDGLRPINSDRYGNSYARQGRIRISRY